MEGSGNPNNNLVVGPDGAIYHLVKQSMKTSANDAEGNKASQNNGNGSQPQMPCHPQMAAALGMGMGMGMNLSMRDMSGRPGGSTLINPVVNMGNNPGAVGYPPMGNFTSLPVGSVMQPGLVPNVSVSGTGQSHIHNLMDTQMIRSLRGNVNPQDSFPPSNDGQNNAMVRNGNRRRIGENDELDSQQSNKRMRLVPLQTPQPPGQPRRSAITGRAFPLFIESDERNLSHYQCLARKQIEIFESTPEQAGTNAQGRNKPIIPGQVGIRCRHCAKLSKKQRKTGSVYYPNRLDGVYQTAQKMTVGHFFKHCTMIPEEIREKLIFLKNQKSTDSGGKRYWADGVRSLGVVETGDGLAFGM